MEIGQPSYILWTLEQRKDVQRTASKRLQNDLNKDIKLDAEKRPKMTQAFVKHRKICIQNDIFCNNVEGQNIGLPYATNTYPTMYL